MECRREVAKSSLGRVGPGCDLAADLVEFSRAGAVAMAASPHRGRHDGALRTATAVVANSHLSMVNSVALRCSEDGEFAPDQIADILVLDGLVSGRTRPRISQKCRVDYRILISIIAFAVAMVLLVLAFITMARAAAPASDRVTDKKVGIALHQLAALAP